MKCEFLIDVDLVVDVGVGIGVYVTVYSVCSFQLQCTSCYTRWYIKHFCLVLVLCLAPPNIPNPPSELDFANIPVCCAGVQFDLDYLLDYPAIHVQASIDGILHPANQVVIDGNSLYIMGLQANTEYSLNITLSNKFGPAWTDTRVRPLLGGLVRTSVTNECYV